MPKLDGDALIITDEGGRALLNTLLGNWQSAAPLLRLIERRIADKATRQADASERRFESANAYLALLDRAGAIFAERLPAAIISAVSEAIDDLADAATVDAVEELPKPKNGQKRGRSVEHSDVSVFIRSLNIIGWVMAVNAEWLSQSFVAAIFYDGDDLTPDAIKKARSKYDRASQAHKDGRLRAYRDLLKRRKLSFDELAETARAALDST